MSKDKLSDYDGTTAGNNTDIGGISIAEGMLPSAVNNSMRELTRQLGAFANGTEAVAQINFGDNAKAVFGAGSDLQIYHDGSNSYITEGGDQTGDLFIRASNLKLTNASGDFFLWGRNADSVRLYHNNAQKLETTATGIDVTGTVTADGLTVENTSSATASLVAYAGTQDAEVQIVAARGNVSGPDSRLKFYTNNGTSLVQRVDIDDTGDISFYADNGTTQGFFWDASTQRLGLGNTNPATTLDVTGTVTAGAGTHTFGDGTGTSQLVLLAGTTGNSTLDFGDSADSNIGRIEYEHTNDALTFRTNNSERVRITSDGNVGIGTASPDNVNGLTKGGTHLMVNNDSGGARLNVEGSTDARLHMVDTGASANQKTYLTKVDGGNYTISLENDAGSASERLRIDSSGNVMFQTTNQDANVDASSGVTQFSFRAADGLRASTSGSHYFNKFSDGTIIVFRGQGTDEGNISISGTTISYNGGHLARWSQATDGNRIDGLVKGTVMTNLDQMAVWHHEAQPATYYEEGDELPEGVSVGDEKTPAVAAYDEDNEQLNCMAVSSVEGDTNVAGVFVNWDDDDTDFTADMNVAMTGDMVIRIASGTTVARGDLLMSAGDGTAKPQGDDIVRSKTIAKVTSTNVSHTYDDGSYLVPCVLMAC